MNKKWIVLTLAATFIAGIIYYSLQREPSAADYADGILKERVKKDDFMRSSSESPFAKGEQKFSALSYFPPDLRYRIKAELIPIENKNAFRLPASDGKELEYLEYGYASFTLRNEAIRLLILEVTDPGPTRGTLFLAFADSTSARETYGAGRYLELKKIGGMSSVIIDFNKAYNPYCAYNDAFSCPMPPKENIMKVAIRAGEKSWH